MFLVDSEEPVDTDDETGETEDSQTQEAEGLVNMSSPWIFPVAGIAVLAGMYIYFKRD